MDNRTALSDPVLDPQAYKLILARRLRELRTLANLTQSAVAKAMYWSTAKQIRVEAGVALLNPIEVANLLEICGVSDAQVVSELTNFAKLARQRSPLEKFARYITPEFSIYLAFENTATTLRNFENTVVPGLLQTDDYADEVLNRMEVVRDYEYASHLKELRRERQTRLLDRGREVELQFVIDEAALRRTIGSAAVMKRQLAHLLELSEQPNLDLRIIPLAAGVYRSMLVPFALLQFKENTEPSLLYLQYPQGDELVQRDELEETRHRGVGPKIGVSTYVETFLELQQLAPREKARKLLGQALSAH